MDFNKILDEVKTLTYSVGKYIAKEAKSFDYNKVEEKGLNDLVSYVDKTAETLLVNGLEKILPDAGFITEEGTAGHTTENFRWIIDPLDGTTNFTHGLPVYAISIALMSGKELVLGVVYEINRNEMFTAIKGGGAFLNNTPILVSPRTKLSESLLATGFPYYNFEQIASYLKILDELMKTTHGLRRMGSAAVDLAYVACGRFEAFFEYNLNVWDVAAGALIVAEAGGKVVDFKGGDDFLFGREIVAAGEILPELIQVMDKHWS